MTLLQLINAINGKFKTDIVDVLSLPTQFDNATFNPPNDSRWCRFTILTGRASLLELGGPGLGGKTFRYPGVFVAQIFVPVGKGEAQAMEVADAIAAAFRAQSIGGVTYREPSPLKLGRTNDNKWWQVNVTCPFQADDIV